MYVFLLLYISYLIIFLLICIRRLAAYTRREDENGGARVGDWDAWRHLLVEASNRLVLSDRLAVSSKRLSV